MRKLRLAGIEVTANRVDFRGGKSVVVLQRDERLRLGSFFGIYPLIEALAKEHGIRAKMLGPELAGVVCATINHLGDTCRDSPKIRGHFPVNLNVPLDMLVAKIETQLEDGKITTIYRRHPLTLDVGDRRPRPNTTLVIHPLRAEDFTENDGGATVRILHRGIHTVSTDNTFAHNGGRVSLYPKGVTVMHSDHTGIQYPAGIVVILMSFDENERGHSAEPTVLLNYNPFAVDSGADYIAYSRLHPAIELSTEDADKLTGPIGARK